MSEMTDSLEHSRSCSVSYDLDAQCTCGLDYRIQLRTEQEMHTAWRKRAEEAESRLEQERRDNQQEFFHLDGVISDLRKERDEALESLKVADEEKKELLNKLAEAQEQVK